MISFPLFSTHRLDMANPMSDNFDAIHKLYTLVQEENGICAKAQTVAFGILAGAVSLFGVGVFTPLIFRCLVYKYIDWHSSRSQGLVEVDRGQHSSLIEFDSTLTLKATFLTTPTCNYFKKLPLDLHFRSTL